MKNTPYIRARGLCSSLMSKRHLRVGRFFVVDYLRQTLKDALFEKYSRGTPERPVEIPFPWVITVLSDVGEGLLFAFQHNVLHLVSERV